MAQLTIWYKVQWCILAGNAEQLTHTRSLLPSRKDFTLIHEVCESKETV